MERREAEVERQATKVDRSGRSRATSDQSRSGAPAVKRWNSRAAEQCHFPLHCGRSMSVFAQLCSAAGCTYGPLASVSRPLTAALGQAIIFTHVTFRLLQLRKSRAEVPILIKHRSRVQTSAFSTVVVPGSGGSSKWLFVYYKKKGSAPPERG